MRFPERDLSDQYISLSYQDVLQQYVNTGSSLYVLDGYGNVVFGILTSSLGDTLITSNMTASMTVLSASYAQTIVHYQVSSSWASQSLSSSYAVTASFALNGGGGGGLGTGSTYPFTASAAVNAINALAADFALLAGEAINTNTASYALTASFAMNGGGGGSVVSCSWASMSMNSMASDFALLAGEAISATSAVNAQAADFALLAGEAINTNTASLAFTASRLESSGSIYIDGAVDLNPRTPITDTFLTIVVDGTPRYLQLYQ